MRVLLYIYISIKGRRNANLDPTLAGKFKFRGKTYQGIWRRVLLDPGIQTGIYCSLVECLTNSASLVGGNAGEFFWKTRFFMPARTVSISLLVLPRNVPVVSGTSPFIAFLFTLQVRSLSRTFFVYIQYMYRVFHRTPTTVFLKKLRKQLMLALPWDLNNGA